MIIMEAGKHPDVKALVYVAAFQPDVGESVSDLADKMPPPNKSIGRWRGQCFRDLGMDERGWRVPLPSPC